jgi:hypothetical protein
MARHSVSITAWPSLELWNSPSLTSSINRSVALDLAKNVFEIDGVDNNGRVLVRRQIRRSRLSAFFTKRAPCLTGMEALRRRSRSGL